MKFMPMIPVFIIYAALLGLVAFTVYSISNKKLRHLRTFRRIFIVALLLLALARPVLTGGESERSLSSLNIFFVVDNTNSMVAKDMDNNSQYRYKVVSEDIKSIVKLFPGAKYGVIILDFGNRQAVPLMSDADTIYSFADAILPKNGTLTHDSELGGLLNYSAERIKSYSEKFPDRKNLLIFMSDGEDANSNRTEVPSDLRKLLSGGAVIGYGTTTGSVIGKVKNDGTISSDDYIKDKGSVHISKLDEDNLKEVASNLNVKYYKRSSSAGIFDNTDNFIDSHAAYSRSDEKTDNYKDLYWVIILIAIGLALWDFSTILDELLLERKEAK